MCHVGYRTFVIMRHTYDAQRSSYIMRVFREIFIEHDWPVKKVWSTLLREQFRLWVPAAQDQ